MRIIQEKQEDGLFTIRIRATRPNEGTPQTIRDVARADVKKAIVDAVFEFKGEEGTAEWDS